MKYLKGLLQWVGDEALKKKNIIIDTQEWKLIDRKNHVPKQSNNCDCGVFVTACADFISDDLPLSYDQGKMPHYRQKIGTDIIRGSLLYPMGTLRTK